VQIFRAFLIIVILAIVSYTLIVGINHGWNLLPLFFGSMWEMAWQGQFNFDFTCFLLLSGLWTSWRNGFTPLGILLGAIAVFLGIMFLAPYLLVLTYQEEGNIRSVLAGPGD
jgi:hypothetical protein